MTRVDITLAADHPTRAGHFPGNPIIPGAVLLREIADLIVAGHPGRACREVISAKFLHPVRPGDTITVTWNDAIEGRVRFVCCLAPDGHDAVSGALRLDHVVGAQHPGPA
jgi:3-hydroxymyristoyl/3-hydroxydecanoyl-(acyl carrier protein) dehydratase